MILFYIRFILFMILYFRDLFFPLRFYLIMSVEDDLIADKFTNAEKIGEGTYGIVFKVHVKETGALKALKRIRLNQ